MRRGLALPLAAVALLLAGCAPTVSMTPAPQASSARCAGVIVRLPDTVGAERRRETDAQATAAWGTPVSVTLTCGVPAPGPTTTECVTVGGVDWLLEQQRIDGVERRVLTTYGRVPATRIVVDPDVVPPDTALNALAEPVAAATPSTGHRCRGTSDPTP